MARAILFDSTKCVGCRECEKACAGRWGNPYNEAIAATEKLSAGKLITIVTRKPAGAAEEKYVRRSCMHCLSPACASACPVAALHKTAEGPVMYDETKCMGCRYCMVACAFNIPAYEWNSRLPRVKKCDMCAERQAAGKKNACVEACPMEAVISGQREDLIAEARKRLGENPKDYYQKIYGLDEVGGTSLLYIAGVPFEQLGLRTDLEKTQLPELTWRVLSHIPDIAGLGTVLLGGVWWITHRREEVAMAEKTEKKA